MTRRPWLFAFGFASLLFSAHLTAAPLEENQVIKLPNGHSIKVLSVTKVEYSKGVMALMVRYETSLSVEERKALSEEVDDLWTVAVKDVERYKYSEAIIVSNEEPKGIFVTANHMLSFIYEKGPDGKWTRLNRSEFMAVQ